MNNSLFEMKDGKEVYVVKKVNRPINGHVIVPGSKSITNRALLLAAISTTDTELRGVLFSDDSRCFIKALKNMGFSILTYEDEKIIKVTGTSGVIPNKLGIIDVGSAGTAARFLTAFIALSDCEYTINCSEQMKKRPMKQLFDVLTEMGAQFEYLEEDGYLPVKVKGNNGICKDISINIETSTQFLSALLMVAPITNTGMKIHITGDKKDGSYIKITRRMLRKFGARVEYDGYNYFVPGGQNIKVGTYTIEPDMSAACYFYAIAAITGGNVVVKNIFFNCMQGDVKFFGALERIGCKIEEGMEGITVHGPVNGEYCGIDMDLNDFSDQSMTLAVIAAFAKTKTVIRNIEHIMYQECDRIHAIVNELNKVGMDCTTDGVDITIIPRKIKSAVIDTYNDHRVAMAFTLLGIRTEGIIIDNPSCCKKTFENYFEVLEDLLSQN